MGEWLSSNVLLPLMYFLIDMGIAFAVLLLAMHLLEKLISSKIFKNIGKWKEKVCVGHTSLKSNSESGWLAVILGARTLTS